MTHFWHFLDGIQIFLILGVVWVSLHSANNLLDGIASLFALILIVRAAIQIKKNWSLMENR